MPPANVCMILASNGDSGSLEELVSLAVKIAIVAVGPVLDHESLPLIHPNMSYKCSKLLLRSLGARSLLRHSAKKSNSCCCDSPEPSILNIVFRCVLVLSIM